MRARHRLAAACTFAASAALLMAASAAAAKQHEAAAQGMRLIHSSAPLGAPVKHLVVPRLSKSDLVPRGSLPKVQNERPFVPRLPDGRQAVNRPWPGVNAGAAAGVAAEPATALTSLQPASRTSPRVGGGFLPTLDMSFEGINHFDQRWASDGFANTQFSLEPPDQGLCVGNGYVVELTNDVIAIYDATDGDLLGMNNLNSFFGYAPQIIRPSGPYGPFLTDPQCIYDADTHTFILDELTLDIDPSTGDFLGTNHLDIAVAPDTNPFTGWVGFCSSGSCVAPGIYTTDDGTNGTPVHANCPCIGDYPHIGADANGVYISTNEYSFFGSGYNGAQIYALSKVALTGGLPSLFGTMIENATLRMLRGPNSPGFTVWPANSPGSTLTNSDPEYGGTEWFASTTAGDGSETGNFTGKSSNMGVWALRNTSALNTANPQNVAFSSRVIPTQTYTFPPKSTQKVGSVPLADCLNLGVSCIGFTDPFAPNKEGQAIDSNDTRVQQPWYCCGLGGRLISSADTGVATSTGTRAGIAWFVMRPSINAATLTAQASVTAQGRVGTANANFTYPSIAVRPDGHGVMAFSVMKNNGGAPFFFPSQGWMSFGFSGPTPGTAVLLGAGPDDGFTNYPAFVGSPVRTRWGDYSATVLDPGTGDIWIGNEMINQTCTVSTYMSDSTCGFTRSALANWSTEITQLTP